VLDIACGGGDVLGGVARRARRRGIPVVLHGCDVSPVALDEVRRRAAEFGCGKGVDGRPDRESPSVSLGAFALDALRDPIPQGYDLIVTALFLHHLERADAIALLRRMAEQAGQAVLAQDLARTPLGYALAWLGLHTLTTSDVARVDGLRSVRAAFSVDEVRVLCAEAGLAGARVEHAWPERFTVRWARH
jgi:SAM-dependent methyltransferase